EIISPSAKHEAIKDIVALLINVWAEELGIDLFSYGSTTFRRQDLERGFEPDTCFYINHVEHVRGKDQLALTVDPPPDLIVEIDITNSSIDKLEIFGQIGVPEVWLFDGERLEILVLQGDKYVEQEESSVLTGLTLVLVTRFLHSAQSMPRPEWLKLLRRCAREK
ncbi:MAG TPA: Uma2 family endonuclease, partial [Blastocatellia bacterium]